MYKNIIVSVLLAFFTQFVFATSKTIPDSIEALPKGVESLVKVSVRWLENTEPGGPYTVDAGPVEGVRVFNHNTNKLLGKTGKDGVLVIKGLPNGTQIRLVEPEYGAQQSIMVVNARKHWSGQYLAVMGDYWEREGGY